MLIVDVLFVLAVFSEIEKYWRGYCKRWKAGLQSVPTHVEICILLVK